MTCVWNLDASYFWGCMICCWLLWVLGEWDGLSYPSSHGTINLGKKKSNFHDVAHAVHPGNLPFSHRHPSVHGEFYMTGPCLPAHVIHMPRRFAHPAAQARLCAVALPPCSRVYVARLAKGSSVATHPVGLRPSVHDWAMPSGSCHPHAPQIRPSRRHGHTFRSCTATLLLGLRGGPRPQKWSCRGGFSGRARAGGRAGG